MFTKGSVNFVRLVPYVLLVIGVGAEPCLVNSITPTCSRLHRIVLNMDQTRNPCGDYFSHACNNYGLHHDVVDHQVNLKLIIVMETLYPRPLPHTNSSPSIFDKSYIYYQSCINVWDTNLLRYFELIKPGKDLEWPLIEVLHACSGGETNFDVNEWPAVQFDVFALLGQLQSYGLSNVLIYQEVLKEDSVLLIGRADIEKQYYFSESVLQNVLKGWGLPEEIALKYVEDIMDTQEYWHTQYQNYSFLSQPYSISYGRLRQQFPYLSIFLENKFLQSFPDTQNIHLYNTRYFEFLLTKQWSAKEAQNLCNYLMLRFLVYLQEDKPKDFSKLACIKDLRSKLDLPTNLLYYEYVYQPDELHYNREINAFFNKTLHYTMSTVLENQLNLAKADLDELRANVSSISLNIGNLPRNLLTPQVEKFFQNIPDLDLDNYYQNHLHLLRHRVLKSLLPFNTQTHVLITNIYRGSSSYPFYDYTIRQVVLPFGIFQPPHYHHTFDPIFKWSTLGFQLAYAITRSVLANVLRLVGEHRLDDCFQHMGNSSISRDDIFAAVVAAHVAYKAYANEQRIQLQPTFTNISWKKLFFLNLANQFCIYKESKWSYEILRFFQNLMNLQSFGRAFRCPIGSKIYPNEMCRLF